MSDQKNYSILIIDDDLLVANALAARLERREFLVEVVTEPTVALEMIGKGTIDIVLLDIVMPQMDGISLLREIRKKFSTEQLPVLMVTAVDDSSDILDAFSSGASDYIIKPVNIDAAVSRIKGQLSTIELLKERKQKQDIEVVNALITTYHHEINNPLMIALVGIEAFERTPQVLGL